MRFKNAIESKSFASNEANEQMIQQSAQLASIDLKNVPTQFATNTSAIINTSINYSDKSFEEMLNKNPTARNLGTYGSFLRQTGQYEKSLKYLSLAHAVAPHKQSISFEYITALIANNKFTEALALAKSTYDDEPTFDTAKQVLESINKEIASSTKTVIKKK